MEGDSVVLIEAAESRKQSSRHGWKLVGALLAVTLCAAAATLCFTWNAKEREHTEKSDDLRHMLRQISGNVRAAIHLEGAYNDSLKTSVEWKKEVDQYHSQGGLELDHNEIVIPQNGLYFVYSQASFHVSCHSDDEGTAKSMVHLSHTVKRWSACYGDDDAKKDYRPILHSDRTACQRMTSSDPDKEGSWFSAIYMGAVFNLRRGDRLKTEMEERLLADLDDDAGKTFFGVFAL